MLGDIGGLADAVFYIGYAVIAILQAMTGNPLARYLISNIFEKDNTPKTQLGSVNSLI